jgi:hypothetical protein
MGWNRRRARYGLPVRQFPQVLARLLSAEVDVMVIGERESTFGGTRQRVPECRFSSHNG